jgi:hypothetical protein
MESTKNRYLAKQTALRSASKNSAFNVIGKKVGVNVKRHQQRIGVEWGIGDDTGIERHRQKFVVDKENGSH